MKHKLLLKDLPFCERGTIITKIGDTFQTDGGETFYESGGSSHNGVYQYEGVEKELLKTLWENEDWLGQYDSGHYFLTNNTNEVILRFKTNIPTEVLGALVRRLSSMTEDLIERTLKTTKH